MQYPEQSNSVPELTFPAQRHTDSGSERRVGVELEMNGVTLRQLADLVADNLQGRVQQMGRYDYEVQGDPAGKWVVELDFDLLKRMGREVRDQDSVLDDLEQTAEDVLAWFAESLVPVELVSPPLPFSRLSDMNRLIGVLRAQGARGTSDSIVNAFGLHLNPEVPSLTADSITAILKAFFCLFDWLRERADIDMTRRVTSYIDPFPVDYVRKVVNPDYWPSQDTLIDDYLRANPTRNRALDMLPLFAHLDEHRVRRAVDDDRVKARPTFHYRLPNCDIHQDGWGLAGAWNDWVIVERLAEHRSWLASCCEGYLQFLSSPLDRVLGDWAAQVETNWVDQLT